MEASALRALIREIKERVVPLLQRDAKLGEELRQSVLPQLQPFGRGAVRNAFSDQNGIDLSLIEKGHIILVEIDEAEHPRAVATVVRMVYRRIVQIARERTASPRVGHLDPIYSSATSMRIMQHPATLRRGIQFANRTLSQRSDLQALARS